MPTGMQFLNDMFPSFTDDMSTEDKLNELMSRVALMAEGMKYLLSNLGSSNFNTAELDSLGKTITEPISAAIEDVDSNLMEVKVTADSAKLTASNALGKAQSVELTVDGLRIENASKSYTIIDGDKLKSRNSLSGGVVQIENGSISLKDGEKTVLTMSVGGPYAAWLEAPSGKLMYLSGELYIGLYDPVGISGSRIDIQSQDVLKLIAGTNMSIDSNGKIFIGASAGYSGDVEIGDGSGTIKINGNFIINGVPYVEPSEA